MAHSVNSQELFQINKRINQIKRNLQSRQQKAHQWSVPYKKILNGNNQIFAQTYQSSFRNSHNEQFNKSQDLMSATSSTKTERKLFYQKKVKQSRKKIKQFHNELKQLQQLLQRKTKLHVKKQTPQQKNVAQQQAEKKSLSLQTMNKTKSMNKTFNSSMIFMGIMNKSMTKHSVRTLKDRVNPFTGFKIQKMIQLYQDTKNIGKQNIINRSLGIGIQYTPYSTLKREWRKDEENIQVEEKKSQLLIDLMSVQKTAKSKSKQSKDNKDDNFKCNRNLPKVFDQKLQVQKQIYLDPPHKNKLNQNRHSYLDFNDDSQKRKKQPTKFEVRMKRILEEVNNFQSCEGNYVEMLKRNKMNSSSSHIGKVRANKPYKTVFQLNERGK